MPRSKRPPTWPSDDQVRELEGDQEFTDDGRKVSDSERVGGMAPDADSGAEPEPDPAPKRPRQPSRR
jgi:hypothetical protein